MRHNLRPYRAIEDARTQGYPPCHRMWHMLPRLWLDTRDVDVPLVYTRLLSCSLPCSPSFLGTLYCADRLETGERKTRALLHGLLMGRYLACPAVRPHTTGAVRKPR